MLLTVREHAAVSWSGRHCGRRLWNTIWSHKPFPAAKEKFLYTTHSLRKVEGGSFLLEDYLENKVLGVQWGE